MAEHDTEWLLEHAADLVPPTQTSLGPIHRAIRVDGEVLEAVALSRDLGEGARLERIRSWMREVRVPAHPGLYRWLELREHGLGEGPVLLAEYEELRSLADVYLLPRDPRQVAGIAASLARILEHLHRHGVTHGGVSARDLMLRLEQCALARPGLIPLAQELNPTRAGNRRGCITATCRTGSILPRSSPSSSRPTGCPPVGESSEGVPSRPRRSW